MKLPTPEARELPADEAWRELFDTFHVLDDEPNEPAPLALEPLAEDEFLRRVRECFGVVE